MENNLEGEKLLKVPSKVSRTFERMRGLGPVNVGSEKWKMAKLKKDRMAKYLNNINYTRKKSL